MKLKWVRVDHAHWRSGGTRYDYHALIEHGKYGWQLVEKDWVHGSDVGQIACNSLEVAQETAQQWEDIEARKEA